MTKHRHSTFVISGKKNSCTLEIVCRVNYIHSLVASAIPKNFKFSFKRCNGNGLFAVDFRSINIFSQLFFILSSSSFFQQWFLSFQFIFCRWFSHLLRASLFIVYHRINAITSWYAQSETNDAMSKKTRLNTKFTKKNVCYERKDEWKKILWAKSECYKL